MSLLYRKPALYVGCILMPEAMRWFLLTKRKILLNRLILIVLSNATEFSFSTELNEFKERHL